MAGDFQVGLGWGQGSGRARRGSRGTFEQGLSQDAVANDADGPDGFAGPDDWEPVPPYPVRGRLWAVCADCLGRSAGPGCHRPGPAAWPPTAPGVAGDSALHGEIVEPSCIPSCDVGSGREEQKVMFFGYLMLPALSQDLLPQLGTGQPPVAQHDHGHFLGEVPAAVPLLGPRAGWRA